MSGLSGSEDGLKLERCVTAVTRGSRLVSVYALVLVSWLIGVSFCSMPPVLAALVSESVAKSVAKRTVVA